MSAYIVEDAHIDALINFAISKKASYYFTGNNRRIDFTKETANEIGQHLLNENFRSVNHRYRNEYGKPHKYNFKFKLTPAHSPVAILKAINCLEYQSCEHDEWETSEAYKILDGIKSYAIYALPGYEAANWGV